jgi:CheY-like chemotaxis protein
MITPLSRFLIVDDDDAVRKMFGDLLRYEGHAVRAVASAEAGLHEVAVWEPDAILLDYRMPVMNGLTFLRRLRASEHAVRLPVAVITGDGDFDGLLAVEFARLGASVHFKPLALDDLLDIAHALITSSSGSIRQ